ncbi:MAG: glycoside hydrolase family 32 protein [Ginsengibacter sp.]
MKKSRKFFILTIYLVAAVTMHSYAQKIYHEEYRPQFHFSPRAGWMNDPNGMIYFNKQYHLYYQYYPNSDVWGPMHWGHTTSKDLIHWQQQPIALYPDSLGYIFSGSIIADANNTSGFGKNGTVPLIAIFTHHNMAAEKAGDKNFQTQSIAYSLDEGFTWIKYDKNPVLKNPGIRDFRDPKVGWFEADKKWIMALATFDRVTFYSSADLKSWTKESDFGAGIGAHGGAWECPDLFPLEYDGHKIWVLLVSVNPGGPNGGSATQYFTGDFDGKNFISSQTDTRWLDYGTDNYAGVTFSNTGIQKTFIGWMSNWQYGKAVPTKGWRSAMTIPRNLGIVKMGNKFLVTSLPVKELNNIYNSQSIIENIPVTHYDLASKIGKFAGLAEINFTADKIETFSVTLSNDQGEKMVVGYDKAGDYYYADRSGSGRVEFEKDFGSFHYAPRLSGKPGLDITLIIDNTSLELFADGGLTVMTEIFFPAKPYTRLYIDSNTGLLVKKLEYHELKSTWP